MEKKYKVVVTSEDGSGLGEFETNKVFLITDDEGVSMTGGSMSELFVHLIDVERGAERLRKQLRERGNIDEEQFEEILSTIRSAYEN